MSVRHALLTLLAEHPRHGYQLKTEFEARTGGTWPLNIGQVYTTLQRLERDGLALPRATADDGTVTWQATEPGRAAVAGWWAEPVPRTTAERDELTIKLALAVTTPGVDVPTVLQRQRVVTLRALQALNRTRTEARRSGDVAWGLVLDRLSFDIEAEARWLDHVEATLARGDGRPATTPTGGAPA